MARKRFQPAASGYTILVVDDQEAALVSSKLVLESEGHRVLLADNGPAALELFRHHDVQLLLVDYFMPGMTGEQLVAEIRKLDTQVQIVLQTGYAGEKPPREMLRTLDIQGYHDKAEGPEKMLLWIDVALKAYGQLHCLREAELLKSQIVANISHEFRTPIHIILGYIDLLRDEGLVSAAGEERLAAVRRNAEILLHLVDGFLRLSDADAGLGGGETVTIDAATLRAELERWAEHFIAGKPTRFAAQIPDDLPPFVVDSAKLRVVIMNLLSNAAKFTPAGTITVAASTEEDAVIVRVSDSGIGIDAEHLERIFEPFHQGHTHSDLHEGTGIGLTIARRLARQMAGEVTVVSEVGRGSTFSLRLPRALTSTLDDHGSEMPLRPAATGT